MAGNPATRPAADKKSEIVCSGIKEFSTYSYSDSSTDRIMANIGISKGLLYHYFGTKKNFYLYCLQCSLDILTKESEPQPKGDLYEILFTFMEQKMRNCIDHPSETKLLNMASKEFSEKVKAEKDAIINEYLTLIQARSAEILKAVVATLNLEKTNETVAAECLKIYVSALIRRYLLLYQDEPLRLFDNKASIMGELKQYIDLMLYGICKEKK